MKNKLIYFDNAATGYPKPQSVIYETVNAFSEYGGNPGRSGHKLSVSASSAIFSCREEVAKLLGYKYPERVVFTCNATMALNMAIKGLCTNNSHILISNFEHNSVLRPVYALCKNPNMKISHSVFRADFKNDSDVISDFLKMLRYDTRMVVVTYASNVCGRILPIREISEICRERRISLIIDASQALGETNVSLEGIYFDALCSAGHKGLYGPTGTGFAVFGKHAEPRAIIEGGNGILSFEREMRGELPERLEAGTLNTFGILGLCEGIKYVKNLGIDNIHSHCNSICEYLSGELVSRGAYLYSEYENKVPIILFNLKNFECDEVSFLLDNFDICTRSGFHCAPLAHKALGTDKIGAVRVSIGYSNTFDEARSFLEAIDCIISSKN